MGALGRFTTYVGGAATTAHTLLAKLFPANPFAGPLASGNEAAAIAIVQPIAVAKVANGVGGIQPTGGLQAGDLNMFPIGVDLSFAGGTLQPPNSPPDVSKVKWTNPGDPANPYIPDITSPGIGPNFGQTAGTDKNVDPGISVATIETPGFATNSDTSGDNLVNPIVTGPAINTANTLGTPQTDGESGGGN